MSIKEAKKLMKEGDDALKTGLFKWNKDYATAAISYDEAAKIFRLLKDYDNVIKACEKSAAVNDKLNDPWGKGRNYETIVQISLDRTDKVTETEPLIEWTRQAGLCFRLANSVQTYVNLVKKVAKFFEEKGLELEACNLYKELVNDLESDEQFHLKSEVVQVYSSLLVKMKKHADALSLFEREFIDKKAKQQATGTKQNLDTLALTVVSLNLIIGDIDSAEKRLQEFSLEIKDFIRTPEFDASEKMIEAYIDGKQDDFDKNSQRSLLNNIFPLNIVKDLRKVKVKAMPGRRKVIELDTGAGSYNNFENENTKEGEKETAEPVPAVTEEQRQQALDDFLC